MSAASSTPSFRHDVPGTPASQWQHDGRWSGVRRLELRADVDRLVVVAAHPDDEALGAGALAATCGALAYDVDVIVLSDGEASHPRSPTHTPAALAARRRLEAEASAASLGARLRLVGLPDGALAEHRERIVRLLVEALGDARRTLLVAPWRRDGHPDHEAVGRAAAVAAVRTGARLLEYPIWFWHHADPDDAPWTSFVALEGTPRAARAKASAVAAHASQVAPLSPRPGDEVLLGDHLLAHFASAVETYVAEPADDPVLDELHRPEGADPWGVEDRWYERRKRELTLAALPRPRFERAVEVGCSRGALSAALAPRCGSLLALDRSPAAVRQARSRDPELPAHVEVSVLDVPHEWPEGRFDLVVLSEVGYFLSPVALETLFSRVRGALTANGAVVLCHWRHPVAGWVLDGPSVHALALEAGLPPERARHRERDLDLLVLSTSWPEPDA